MDWTWLSLLILVFSKEIIGVPVWRWDCVEGFCEKARITPATRSSALGLSACRLTCLKYAGLWPYPTGEIKVGKVLNNLNVNNVLVVSTRPNTPSSKLLDASAKRFKDLIRQLSPTLTLIGDTLIVNVDIKDPTISRLNLTTDESYTLKVNRVLGVVTATITAPTYFGGRHGLETLGQLIVYDDVQDVVKIATDVSITDAPVYPHRGLLLDTARNYISVDSIKRTIDGMAANKLNTFHWHITDSQSFPFVSKSHPFLSELGAYSPSKVFTRADIADVVQFGRENGVRVIPEFDSPAHVGEGWQDTSYITCFNQQPWQSYCNEPPCGQLDPTQPNLYNVLDGIYKDLIEQFEPDVFHMGGDEVSQNCWNATESIVQWMLDTHGWDPTAENFVKLWAIYQSKALERLTKHSGPNVPVTVWTSSLTQDVNVEMYLPKDRYIIQVWTTGTDPQISVLLDQGYRLILSNYDALYLDCGFAAWTSAGNNWCSPYIGWQKIYGNSPAAVAGNKTSQMLGAEACLWSEEVDDASVDNRFWPRAAALAERVWAEPNGTWFDAQERMMVQRQRLIQRGIQADTLQPEWCTQNEQNCPQGGLFNN